jgi:hypothetical protein
VFPVLIVTVDSLPKIECTLIKIETEGIVILTCFDSNVEVNNVIKMLKNAAVYHKEIQV